jgi:hypothetical protein
MRAGRLLCRTAKILAVLVRHSSAIMRSRFCPRCPCLRRCAGQRGGFADAGFLCQQVPLTGTARELCAVARDVHADPGDIDHGDGTNKERK